MSIQEAQPSLFRRRVRLAWVASLFAGVATASSVVAEPNLRTTDLHSGLHTFVGGSIVLLTLTEVGPPGSFSRATLSLYDDADRLLSSVTGVARRAKPVRIEFTLPANPPRVQVRASVSMTLIDGGSSAPVAGLESFDPLNLTMEPRIFCAPGSGRIDPETLCPDWEVESVASAE